MSTTYGVSWARVSDQIQTSLSEQHRGNRSRAAATGVHVPDDAEYQDVASRSDQSRWAGFDKLLERIQDPDCKYVFAWQDSRLIGDEQQFLMIHNAFVLADVRLIYQNGSEQDLQTHVGKLIGLLNGWNNAGEVIRTRQRVHDTHKIKAEAGRLISRPPYGIDVIKLENAPCGGACGGDPSRCSARHGEVSKKGTVWVVNEPEVEILKLMFRHIADGRSWGELVRRLTAMGVGTRERVIERSNTHKGELAGGQPWVKTSIRRLLVNEFYRGVFTWNKTLIKRVGPVKTIIDLPRDEWVATPHALGPIVDPDLWDDANEQIARRSKTREEQRTYPLMLWDKFLTCGRCGWNMSPYRRNNGTKNFGKLGGSEYDYRCNGVNHPYGKCTVNHSVAERALDHYLGADVTVHHLMPKLTVTFQEGETDRRDTAAEMRALQTQLAELEEERLEALRMERRKRYTEAEADVELEMIRKQTAAADERLAELRQAPEAELISSNVPEALRELWPLLRNEELPIEERRLALGRLIDRVIVNKPNLHVVLRPDMGQQ